jgi:DNA (cytosine-5)-methyltransferase 1
MGSLEREPEFPTPTHSGPHETRKNWDTSLGAHVTTGEAIGDLSARDDLREPNEEVNGRYGHLLPDIPPGDNYLFYTQKRGHPTPLFKWRSRFWSFLLKLDPLQPSPTIQAQPGPYVGPFHWQNRRLRLPEIKRLQTFPDDYEIVGSRRSAQMQIGNAVPPLLAEQIARSLRSSA